MNPLASRAGRRALAAAAVLLTFHVPTLAQTDNLCSFRMQAADSFTVIDGWLVFSGRVASGAVRVGDPVRVVLPDGTSAVRSVGAIEAFGREQEVAREGDIVGIGLADADRRELGDGVALEGHCGPLPGADDEAPAAAESEASAADVPREWFNGLRTVSDPDGRFQGATQSLIERVVDRANGTITETIVEQGRLITVTLRETGRANVFAVERDDGAYTGTITFSPDAWTATEWTYELALPDGRRIEGTGRDEGKTVVIEQALLGADGERQEAILERVDRVEASIYEAKRRTLVRQ